MARPQPGFHQRRARTAAQQHRPGRIQQQRPLGQAGQLRGEAELHERVVNEELPVPKLFRLLDQDGDGYINQSDTSASACGRRARTWTMCGGRRISGGMGCASASHSAASRCSSSQ